MSSTALTADDRVDLAGGRMARGHVVALHMPAYVSTTGRPSRLAVRLGPWLVDREKGRRKAAADVDWQLALESRRLRPAAVRTTLLAGRTIELVLVDHPRGGLGEEHLSELVRRLGCRRHPRDQPRPWKEAAGGHDLMSRRAGEVRRPAGMRLFERHRLNGGSSRTRSRGLEIGAAGAVGAAIRGATGSVVGLAVGVLLSEAVVAALRKGPAKTNLPAVREADRDPRPGMDPTRASQGSLR